MNQENSILELAKIQSSPAVMSLSYEEAKSALSQYLEKYRNVVITDDGAKEGKELIAEINVTRKELDKRRKEAVAEASAPIKLFDQQMKELVAMCDELKDAIRVQTDKYDNEQKAKAKKLLSEFLAEQWVAFGVTPEFQKSQVDGLVSLGAITAKGNLTGKSKAEVINLANSDLSVQNMVALRLKDLEAQSYKAGLSVPISESIVRYFIFNNESDYQQKLQEIIAAEVAREAQAKAMREAEEKARLEAVESRRVQEAHEAEQRRLQEAQESEQRRLNDLAEAEKRHQEAQSALFAMAQAQSPDLSAPEVEMPPMESYFDSMPDSVEPEYDEFLPPAWEEESAHNPMEQSNGLQFIGAGDCGGSATIKLSFNLPQNATKEDVINEIQKALCGSVLAEFVLDVKAEILPF